MSTPKPRRVLGVDIGGTNVRAGVVRGDAVGTVRANKLAAERSAEEVLAQVYETIDACFEPGVSAIGVGVPSVVDVERGIVLNTQNIPSWQEVHLKSALEAKYSVPAFVNNDANCFALGELYFGGGRGCRSLVGLVIGTGLGAGIIIDGRLYPGANCGAGEIGMLPYRDGILEHYASGQFFSRQLGAAGDTLFEAVQRKDETALRAFTDFGTHFGKAVAAALYAFDPEMIVLGGSVSQAYPYFEASMRQALSDFAYPNTVRRLRIEVSRIQHVQVLGAAALCLETR